MGHVEVTVEIIDENPVNVAIIEDSPIEVTMEGVASNYDSSGVTVDNITQVTNRSHTDLQDIGTNTHSQIDFHLADSTIHFTQTQINITESQISDLQNYLTTINGLNISLLNNDSGYTTFTPTTLLFDYGFTDNSSNWDLAYSWGDHSTEGYLTTINGLNISSLNNDTGFITGYTVTNSDLVGLNISNLTNDSGYITSYTVTQADVTQYQTALSITESQISDLGNYQDELVSGTNIKTINSQSLLGSGNIEISGQIAQTFETISKNLSALDFTITYNVDGNVTSIVYTGGITKTINYDVNGNVTDIVISGLIGNDLRKNINYDVDGNVDEITYEEVI